MPYSEWAANLAKTEQEAMERTHRANDSQSSFQRENRNSPRRKPKKTRKKEDDESDKDVEAHHDTPKGEQHTHSTNPFISCKNLIVHN